MNDTVQNAPKDEKPVGRTTQISSNKTLFWRIFVPTAGLSFWIAMNVGVWIIDKAYINIPFISGDIARVLMAFFLVLWLVYTWKRLFSFHRVEADSDYIYATNYWHYVRYPWKDVAGFEKKKSFMTKVVDLKLKAAGKFGQSIRFLPSRDYDDWIVGRKFGA